MKIKLLIFILCFVTPARADIIYLKNGDSIEGLIKKEDERSIVLNVGFGTVEFKKTEIERIERSDAEGVLAIREKWEKEKELEIERRIEREKEEQLRREKEFEPKEVEFSRKDEHIIVDALLNGRVKASLLLDTGATLVLLSDRIVRELGIRDRIKDKKVEIRVADGRTIVGNLVVLDSISIQDVTANNVEAVVLLESQSDMGDGLLGMSFLNKFDFQIDAVNRKLILKKKRKD